MARIRPVSSYARRGPVQEPYDTVLIVCEGTKTEPNYFNGMKSAFRLSSTNVAVTSAPGSDPLSVVQHTEALMAEEEYDRVFSVFDRDGHQNFAAAVAYVSNHVRGRAGTWQAITSTPCFELWLCLHFAYSTAPIVGAGQNSAGDNAVRALREHLAGYTKGDKAIYQKVGNGIDAAVANGIKLTAHNLGSGSSNPATEVHKLVDYLRKLKPS
jgi:hypothetical protein